MHKYRWIVSIGSTVFVCSVLFGLFKATQSIVDIQFTGLEWLTLAIIWIGFNISDKIGDLSDNVAELVELAKEVQGEHDISEDEAA